MGVCDKNCFSCIYEDCIFDGVEYSDFLQSEEIDEGGREYKTPKQKREYYKKYYQENREHCREVDKKYYEAHVEERRAYSRRYSKENKERKAAYLREWRKRKKDGVKNGRCEG